MNLIDLTNEVADALAVQYHEAQVSVAYLPDIEAGHVVDLTIFVLPAATACTESARQLDRRTDEIQIAVINALHPGNESEEIPANIALVEDIVSFLNGLRPLNAYPEEVRVEPLYSIEHARTAKLFVSIIHLTLVNHV